jgi:type II secretory pathway pseudopilin PulG
LVEVLLAIALTGILLTVLSKILIPGFQIWKHTQAMSAVEQNGMLAELKIENALLGSTSNSITYIDEPNVQAVSFLNHEGTEGAPGYDGLSGKTLWQSMTCFKLDLSGDELVRLRWSESPLPTTEVFAFTPAQLLALCNSGQEGVRVAEKVRSLRVEKPSDQRAWTVTLELRTETPTGEKTLTKTFSVLPRIQELP